MNTIQALGLMSGTSLDGLDICHAEFRQNKHDKWSFKILNAETVSYSKSWLKRLRNAPQDSAPELYQLNAEYGFYLGEQTQNFITKHKLKDISVIASHGHTVFHQPEKKFTVQIGDGRAIRAATGISVAYDFRSQDVLLGGNGAPLVPIGDELLFSDYGACLNLGGFSNISFKVNKTRIAYDICPVNILLNRYAAKLGAAFDEGGMLARSGSVSKSVLDALNSLDYYAQPPPKSLGFEWVETFVLPLLGSLSPADALATFTEHAAQQLAKALNALNIRNVLCTGGGAYNTFLLERAQELTKMEIVVPDSKTVEFKEALIFAFIGVLRLKGENNVLASATGSRYDHCSGLLI